MRALRATLRQRGPVYCVTLHTRAKPRSGPMRHMLTIAAMAAFAASITLAPAFAEDRPFTKGPTKSLGDGGKLPPTHTMSDAVPDMTGPDDGTSAQGAGDGTAPTRPDAT